MISKPTVLVLGAGASQHLDYPLGSELKREIVAMLKDPRSVGYQTLAKMGYTADQIGALYQSLSFSGRQTIDAFLEHRNDLLEIGKTAIAVRLIQCERVEMLFEKEPNWYSHLYARMNSTFGEFARNELSIVTFNYDRSLEAFLFQALKNSYGKTDGQIADSMKSLAIIHVHGSLGPLPWQERGGREYTPIADTDHIREAAQSIRIFTRIRLWTNSLSPATAFVPPLASYS